MSEDWPDLQYTHTQGRKEGSQTGPALSLSLPRSPLSLFQLAWPLPRQEETAATTICPRIQRAGRTDRGCSDFSRIFREGKRRSFLFSRLENLSSTGNRRKSHLTAQWTCLLPSLSGEDIINIAPGPKRKRERKRGGREKEREGGEKERESGHILPTDGRAEQTARQTARPSTPTILLLKLAW